MKKYRLDMIMMMMMMREEDEAEEEEEEQDGTETYDEVIPQHP